MSISAIYILSGIAGVAAAVLAFIFIIPESKRAKLNPFFAFLHDLFNFKTLFLERILKFLYVLATVTSVAMGSLMLFWVEERTHYVGSGWYNDIYETSYEWYGYYGILVLIFAPIAIRVFYEAIMMFILLVQNTIDINKKLGKEENTDAPVDAPVVEALAEEVPAEPQTPKMNFCIHCGGAVGEDNKCTKCGEQY